MRGRCVVGVVAAATLSVAACTAGEADPVASPQQSAVAPEPSVGASVTVAGLTANYHGTQDVRGGAQNVTISLKNFYFEPTVLRGAAGQQMRFTLRNDGETAHTFTTADQSADIEVQPGMVAEGRITLPASGNVSFFCRFHKAQGMAGAFNVSGPIDSSVQGPTVSPRPS